MSRAPPIVQSLPTDLQPHLDELVLRTLPPLATTMAVLFALFAAYDLGELDPDLAGLMAAYDLVVAFLFLALAPLARSARPASAHPLVIGMMALSLSNVLANLFLTGEPFYTNYVNITVFGLGCIVLSPTWLTLGLVLTFGTWVPVMWLSCGRHDLLRYGFTVVASTLITLVIHQARMHNARRIVAFRVVDEHRRRALEAALGAAEAARARLDEKVEERTAQLRAVNDALTRQIEERERAEATAHDLSEQLLHAQKMESIGRLAGGVAHDFNNLLTVVISNLQLGMEEGEPSARAATAMTEAQAAARRGADLARQLLAFSRKQVMRPRPVDLAKVVTDLEGMLRRAVGDTVQLQLRCFGPGTWIIADPGQIEQVILNLVMNARDAMPQGGRVRVDVAPSDDASRPNAVVLTVTDTGLGMEPDTLEQIFEPFFTTKEPGEGTGLGLAMVYGIVSQHGGSIEVTSHPGEGSQFSVYLPATQTIVPERAVPEPAQHGGSERVLIVEDDSSVRRVAARALERQGYDVLVAPSGDAALELLHEQQGRVDLVLTDVMMPGMDGKELAQAIASRWPHIGLLFASGFSRDIIAPDGVLPPGMAFIAKPYDLKSLGTAVRRALDANAAATTRPGSPPPPRG